MLPVKSWRIIYADGSMFDSTMGTWAEAPPFGVQCVVYYHTDAYTLFRLPEDDSIYYYQGDEQGPGYEGVKMGLWMDSEGYYRLLDMARRTSAP